MTRDGRRLPKYRGPARCEQLGGFYRAEDELKEKARAFANVHGAFGFQGDVFKLVFSILRQDVDFTKLLLKLLGMLDAIRVSLSVTLGRHRKRIAMSAILAAPLVGIAVLATIGQPHSTKRAKFTEPAWLKAADGGVADGIGPADFHKGLTGLPSRNGFLALVVS
jgi:hypothetical protein